jgi:transposase
MSNYNKYDDEFKQNAVKLTLKSGQTLSKTARDLGINKSTLYAWAKAYKMSSSGKLTLIEDPTQEIMLEMRKIKRENAILREERDILKKAVGIFSIAKQ